MFDDYVKSVRESQETHDVMTGEWKGITFTMPDKDGQSTVVMYQHSGNPASVLVQTMHFVKDADRKTEVLVACNAHNAVALGLSAYAQGDKVVTSQLLSAPDNDAIDKAIMILLTYNRSVRIKAGC